MRRADRLFQLVQILRRGRVTTAARLAQEIEVSERTIYRDIADLIANGMPIEGEAGVGYVLPASLDLPPLMFDRGEVEALAIGARLVAAWTDEELARSAKSALVKVEQVLPSALRSTLGGSRVFVPEHVRAAASHAALPAIREALASRRVLAFAYASERGEHTRRNVEPLGLFHWGRVWTLVALCRTRDDFRSFRVDRMEGAKALDERFEERAGRSLEDYLARVVAEGASESAPSDASDAQPARNARAHAKPVPARPVKLPKLDLDAEERTALREASLTARDLATTSADELHRRVHGALPSRRCAELTALAQFQQLGSIGLESARDLVKLGFRRVEELAGHDARELFTKLERLTRGKQDPCVEDAFRCAIEQANDPQLPSELRDWWHWTHVRGAPPGTRPPLPRSKNARTAKRAPRRAR